MFYVISDVHSNYIALKQILDKLDNKKDQLFIVGDVIDRGNDGFKILDEIMKRNNIHLILGNHEACLMNVYIAKQQKDERQLNAWKQYWYDGGGEKSYHYFFEELNEEERKKYLDYLFSCSYDDLLKVGGKYFYLVHACPSNDLIEKLTDRRYINGIIDEDLDIVIEQNNDRNRVIITKLDEYKLEEYSSNNYIINPMVIVGHTPTRYWNGRNPQEVWIGRNIMNIDCGSNGFYRRKKDSDGFIGRLACVCLNNMEIEYY